MGDVAWFWIENTFFSPILKPFPCPLRGASSCSEGGAKISLTSPFVTIDHEFICLT